jgi:very-short-patch-repair endonuclease
MEDECDQDAEAIRRTTSLVDYLADLTDPASRNPVYDILADDPDAVIWTSDLPADAKIREDGDELLAMVPVPRVPPPPMPPSLEGWLVGGPSASTAGLQPPRLKEASPAGPDTEFSPELRQAFDRYLRTWQDWAGQEPLRAARRELFARLENVANRLEQRDDEVELVLGTGLLAWRTPDGREIRRHLITAKIAVAMDPRGRITLRRADDRRCIEDRELLEDLECYHPDRGRAERDALLADSGPMLSDNVASRIAAWLGLVLDQPLTTAAGTGDSPLTETPTLRTCPALLLRRRNSALLAETYRRISAALKEPGARVPIGLAQIVVDTNQTERDRWLAAQGAARGDQLGDDPLFPLATNAEQRRVIELLHSETGVVVQGPPGTGKTHTIANLVSALLANGQRVLVTSQKDQALRVLREKIPDTLRPLCVLLTGNGRDSRVELDRGIDALSTAVATKHPRELDDRRRALEVERDTLQSEGADVSDQIRRVRAGEWHDHGTVVTGQEPGLYKGTLASIVRDVRRGEAAHAWMPEVPAAAGDEPPIDDVSFSELRTHLSAGPAASTRLTQHVPDAGELPRPVEVAAAVIRERELADQTAASHPALAAELAKLAPERLAELTEIRNGVLSDLLDCGLDHSGRDWLRMQLDNRLAGRHSAQRSNLSELARQARALHARLVQLPDRTVVLPPLTQSTLGHARQLLTAGREYADFLRAGGRPRRLLPSRQQKAAADLVAVATVDGRTPASAEELDAVVDRLDIDITSFQLSNAWAMAGLRPEATNQADLLSDFADAGGLLAIVEHIGQQHDQVVRILREARLLHPIIELNAFLDLLDTVTAARALADAAAARGAIEAIAGRLERLCVGSDTCPEVSALAPAVRARDVDAYEAGLVAVDKAREEHRRARRLTELSRAIGAAHPELLDLVLRTPNNPEWQARKLRAAWGWSRARQFVRRQRDPGLEEELDTRYEVIQHRLTETVAELAAVRALLACTRRMTDDQIRALRTYRTLSAKTGKKQSEFRRAAREAISKARDAVPAWVVALPNLLENIAAERDRFDVVIVDEASQVGIDALFLLWMAPRVIVIGDDKQCTPGASSLGLLDRVFARNDEHLAGIDISITRMLTSKSHLYELMEARSGRDAVIGLREHFRCVPEIITWSSRQFYGDGSGGGGLIPLTERGTGTLEPLVVTTVTSAATEGKGPQLRNRAEAQAIVDALVRCLDDPAYTGATFGVVILQSTARRHMAMVDKLIHDAIPVEVRQARKIRVGTASMFQGDERDVIFLSMVVAERPPAVSGQLYRQAFNVAASRAKRQMRLFASVGLQELKSTDLRYSLMSYMLQQPSIYGRSPRLEEVSPDEYCPPFESRLEQRVFRAIRSRGFHVVPQHPLGTRRLDLVVAGRSGRIAVECDGDYWHSGVQREIDDARRDHELRRMRWTTVRVRESGFEFDSEESLAPVWAALEAHGIEPNPDPRAEDWAPVDLPDLEEEQVAS